MKARTDEEFCGLLDKDLGWRKQELSYHRSQLKQSAGVRAAVTMLYAHWEGYIVESSQRFIEFVSKRRITHSGLRDNFRIMTASVMARSQASQLGSGNYSAIAEFIDVVNKCDSLPFVVDGSKVVSGRSNLNSDALEEIVLCLGLDYQPFMLREKMIDESLLRQRNSIAHGQQLEVTAESYEELQTGVIELIEEFKEQLMAMVVERRFRASAGSG